MCTPFESVLNDYDCFIPALLQHELPDPLASLQSIEEGRPLKKVKVSTKILPDGSKLFIATAHKASADSSIGIGLKAISPNLYISSITDGGLLSTTSLKAGQQVLSINNQECQDMSTAEAITLIKSAPGAVTIVATTASKQVAEGTISAEEATESVISSSTTPTLFANGTLEQERITASPATTENIKLITAKVHKVSADSKVGIGLRAISSNVYISSIVDGGLFSHTSLKTGQRVLSINNQDCQGMSTTEAVSLIKFAPGAVTIVATKETMSPIAWKQATEVSAADSSSAIPESTLPKQDHASTITEDENDGDLDPVMEAYLERNRQLVGYSRCVSPLTAIWFSLFAYLRGPVWLVLGFLFTFIQIIICCRLFTNKKEA